MADNCSGGREEDVALAIQSHELHVYNHKFQKTCPILINLQSDKHGEASWTVQERLDKGSPSVTPFPQHDYLHPPNKYVKAITEMSPLYS